MNANNAAITHKTANCDFERKLYCLKQSLIA